MTETKEYFDNLKRELDNAKNERTVKIIDKAGREYMKSHSSAMYSLKVRKEALKAYRSLHKQCIKELKRMTE